MQCPYCQQHYVLTNANTDKQVGMLGSKDNTGNAKRYEIHHAICPNEECKKSILFIIMSYVDSRGITYELFSKKLMPDSISKIYPSYIPEQLREDYEEACKIVDISPKSAATLSRRCLQGIIRDFYGITKRRLADEINELQGKIDPELWDAIDALRKIGNVGAHMENDVNLIVNIEPDEARQLIWLIETLFDGLYVHREEQRKRLRAIPGIAAAKDAQKKGLPASPDVGDSLLTS